MASLDELRRLAELKDWGQALVEYQLLADSGEPLPAEAYWHGGRAAWKSGKVHLARTILERGMAADPNPVMGLQMLFTHSHIQRELGCTAEAIEEMDRYCALSVTYPELEIGEPWAWYNLGLCYRQAQRWSDAIEAYRTAAMLAKRSDQPDLRRKVLQNTAWAWCTLRQCEEAEDALEEAEGMSQTTEAKQQQTIGYAYLRYARGDNAGALELCKELTNSHQSGHTVPDDVLSQVYWVSGCCQLELGNLASAAALADIALERAKACNDHRCWHDACELIQRVQEAKRSASA